MLDYAKDEMFNAGKKDIDGKSAKSGERHK